MLGVAPSSQPPLRRRMSLPIASAMTVMSHRSVFFGSSLTAMFAGGVAGLISAVVISDICRPCPRWNLPMPGYVMAAALVLLVIVAPLLVAMRGLVLGRREASPAGAPARWDWTLTLRSTLLYALAFNLTFFIQELFLVLPKALTPGLRPTLFHNNHRWEGEHPLAGLFQGTGALATVATAIVCLWLLRRDAGRSANTRLFLVWMAYCGLFMAPPQVAIGALHSRAIPGA